MNLFFSVTRGTVADRHDVLLDAVPGTTVREAAEQLAITDAPSGALHLDERPLDPDARLAERVRDGAVLGVGAPPQPASREQEYGRQRAEMPGPTRSPDGVGLPRGPEVELRVCGGPEAGRVHLLPCGTHTVGPRPGSSVHLDGPGVPAAGIRVEIRPDGTAAVLLPTQGEARLSKPQEPAARPPADARPLPDVPPLKPAEGSVDTRKPGTQPGGEAEVAQPPDWQPWPLGGQLAVGRHLLRLDEPAEADGHTAPGEDGAGSYLDFNRPPRITPPLPPQQFTLPGPPTPPSRRPIPMAIVIAPVFVGMLMVLFLNSYFYFMFALLSPIMAVTNQASGRRSAKKDFLHSVAAFRARRAALRREVAELVAGEQRRRTEASPDPATLGLWAVGPSSRLWERRRDHGDHLVLRIGTADRPSQLAVNDGAREENHRRAHWRLRDVPVGVDLPGSGVVGVAGEPVPVRALAGWMLAQAAVLHSPRDVRVTVLTDADRAEAWDWVRWLPHARPGRGGVGPARAGDPVVTIGNTPQTVAERVADLAATVRMRSQARRESRDGDVLPGEPDMLVVLDGARRLRDVPGMVQVLKEGPAVRIFLLCLDIEERLLPEECRAVAVVGARDVTLRRSGSDELSEIRPDLVRPGWCERTARALAPVRDVTAEGTDGLPERTALLDLLDLQPPTGEEIARRWQQRPAGTAAVLGSSYRGALALDLASDGPHSLIAGTTGSGKSELLQTLVGSLAAANRPDELTFVLVDYKGGSAFKDCVRLPHVLGMVTDLDAHQVERALASLTAELTRRERLLAAHGAKDHPEYRGMRRREPDLPPLPRLVLVIDEFATLARELPDFIPGLVGIAQRGRSLGIHLVLATQRPAGVVTADIRANTNLRIALRVTDANDSFDVIDVNDAVSIPATLPGRALVRLGPGAVVPFQTAWVGGRRPEPGGPHRDLPERRPAPQVRELTWLELGVPVEEPPLATAPDEESEQDATDLTALVDAVREAAAAEAAPTQPSPWLPPLAPTVRLPDLPRHPDPDPAGGRVAAVSWAMGDHPQAQRQAPITLDLADFGHLYVIGAPRSGRSQVLRTLAGALADRLSCADVHLYGLDGGGGSLARLTALPHCGAVAPRGDLERTGRLLRRLTEEAARRQELLAEHGAADLTELRSALPADQRPAHLVLLVDGWDTLNSILSDHDGGRPMTELTGLVREGAPLGVHVVATSERALLTGKAATLNDARLMLRLTDRADYAVVGIPPKQVPATVPPGRGWAGDATELQVALLGAEGDSGREQSAALKEIADRVVERDRSVPAARRPFRVQALPSRIGFEDAYERLPASLRRPLWGLVGVAGDDLDPIGADFTADAPTYMIAGPPGSGRSTALATMAVSLLAGGTRVIAVTPRESPLRSLAAHSDTVVLDEPDPRPEQLTEALHAASGPTAVLVDDADLLAVMAQCDPVLKEIASSGRDRGIGLAVAGTAETLSSAGIGWLGQVKRIRRGLLLAPQAHSEGDLLGLRIPLHLLRSRGGNGRALSADPVTGAPVSVLVPETVLRQ